jgi:hypothetical protein
VRFPVAFEAPEWEPAVEAMRKQDYSWGKLNLFSEFLQEIAISAIPFRLPQSKDDSLRSH